MNNNKYCIKIATAKHIIIFFNTFLVYLMHIDVNWQKYKLKMYPLYIKSFTLKRKTNMFVNRQKNVIFNFLNIHF